MPQHCVAALQAVGFKFDLATNGCQLMQDDVSIELSNCTTASMNC